MLGGYFFYSESVNSRVLLGAILAIVGSMVLGYGDFDGGGNALLGDFLALAGAIFVACYVLVGRGVRKKISLLPYIYIVYFSGSLVLLLGSVITKQPLTGYPFDTWVWFVALAVVSTIFGQSFFSWALKYVKAVVVSISILGEPVGATLLAFIIWKQVPDFLQVVGGILIIFGLAIFIRFSQYSNQNERANRRACSKGGYL
jgi:drug/metabolite transporter (DMT)-like permease